jgi:hypothetical protein
MNSESFTYWLQGFVELSDTDTISENQWLMIKDHLKLVFDKVTPVRTPDRNKEVFVGVGDIPTRVYPSDYFKQWKLTDFQSPVQITC